MSTTLATPLEESLASPIPLADVVGLSPADIANGSQLVIAAYKELVNAALSIRNDAYRKPMLDVLRDSRVSFLELYPTRESREAIRDELAALGYMEREDDVDELFPSDHLDPQPYLTAPQSHEDWYNCHPGGMAITCAVNCRLSEYHTQLYQHHYGVPADRDLALAALCIHEYPKAWLYRWNDDGSYAVEPRSFGSNMHTHDIYVVAEMLHRGAPRELVLGVAAAHAFGNVDLQQDGKETRFTWPGYDWVAKFLHAGALLAQRDAVDEGLLEKGSGRRARAAAAADRDLELQPVGHELAVHERRGAQVRVAAARPDRHRGLRDRGPGLQALPPAEELRVRPGRADRAVRGARARRRGRRAPDRPGARDEVAGDRMPTNNSPPGTVRRPSGGT